MQRYLYNLATDKYKGFIPALIQAGLFILSGIYGLAVRFLIFLSRLRFYRLNCKVISVGNITLGGTGKTSLVEYIAHYLKQEGRKVAILSRGYKRKASSNQQSAISYETMGDEPYMLSRSLGDIAVIVDADRVRAARQAIGNHGADTVILDDGFQQWKIKKDLEIVTIDATNPFGNRYLIPRGILREPLTSLGRADIFILTKTNLKPSAECKEAGILTSASRSNTSKRQYIRDTRDLKDFLISINPKAAIFESTHKPAWIYEIGNPDKRLSPQTLKTKTAALFSGIGDPDSFENLIISLGVKVGLSFRFRDHYSYSSEDLDKIVQAAKEKNIDTIITTEKDAVRLCAVRHTPYAVRILVLRINLEIKNEEGFHNRLLRLYSA